MNPAPGTSNVLREPSVATGLRDAAAARLGVRRSVATPPDAKHELPGTIAMMLLYRTFLLLLGGGGLIIGIILVFVVAMSWTNGARLQPVSDHLDFFGRLPGRFPILGNHGRIEPAAYVEIGRQAHEAGLTD